MCGITGFWDRTSRLDGAAAESTVQAMADALTHRGPDGSGTWLDRTCGLALGHRRLAVVDLSPAGHQPMTSADGRYTLTYNGEIYNHAELRADLEAGGMTFAGTSDTEVLVNAIAAWGLTPTLARCIGMFAFALWDRQERALTLVRDRMGIKPLYWGHFGDLTLFGSSLAALEQHPGWPREIDRQALVGYLQLGYIAAPRAVYAGIRKLPPGHTVTIGPDGPGEPVAYWDLEANARRWLDAPLDLDDTALTDELERVLGDAVERRMVADVPLGAFLSGGIDSSTVTALMQARADRPVRTFSIGFHEPGFDEAGHARAVAEHLGTDHTELYVDAATARETIPDLPRWYDEPFADPSQIPTALLSQLTRRHVTVALSGDGGDELFGGYNRYLATLRFSGAFGRIPLPARRLAAWGIRAVPTRTWQAVLNRLPAHRRPPQAGLKVHKFANLIAADGPDALYENTVTHWKSPASVVRGGAHEDILGSGGLADMFPVVLNRMQLVDSLTYLPDDILTKVDRASMAFSLEARVPMLDHRVVELAWRTPPGQRVRHGKGKLPLRRVLDRYVPSRIMDRPKMGFGVPVGDWLRGPLRGWVEDLLDRDRLAREGFFEPEPIRRCWDEHLSGRGNWQHQLWNVLMFQAWYAQRA